MDPQNPLLDILDAHFMAQSYQRYRTPRIALDNFRRLGKPPSSFDNASPGPKVVRAVEIMAALLAVTVGDSHKSVETGFWHYWSSTIGPWFRFFLEKIILVEEVPFSIQGVALRDHVLPYVPALLGLPDHASEAVEGVTRLLQPLLTRAWWKVVDENHPSWGLWSQTLSVLPPSSTPIPKPEANQGLSGNPDLAMIYARHLHRMAQSVRSMSPNELGLVENFMSCLNHPGFLGQSPMETTSVWVDLIPALVTLLDSLLSKPKDSLAPHHQHLGISDPQRVYKIASQALQFLRNMMQDAPFVLKALDAGIVKVLMRSYRHVRYLHSEDVEDRFNDNTQAIIDIVAKYLLYPSILHEFLRSMRSIDAIEGLEIQLMASSMGLWKSWAWVKEKAVRLRDLRRRMKARSPKALCSYHQCPGKASPTDDGNHNGYSRCSSCRIAMYCSFACQKMDWDHEHRELCPTLTESRKNFEPLITDYDRRFFEESVRDYCGRTASSLEKAIVSRLAEMPLHEQLSSDGQLLKNGSKNPLLLIFLDAPELPADMSNEVGFGAVATDIGSIGNGSEMPVELREMLKEMWRSPDIHRDNILVLAYFPRDIHPDHPCVLTTILDYPLSARAGEDEESFTTYEFHATSKEIRVID